MKMKSTWGTPVDRKYKVSRDTTKKRIDGFNIQGTKRAEKCPDECYYCGSKDIIGIEIIGAFDEPLIWECTHCNEHMLRFTRAKTERLLQSAPEIDITEEEWERAWLEGPN